MNNQSNWKQVSWSDRPLSAKEKGEILPSWSEVACYALLGMTLLYMAFQLLRCCW